MANNTGTPTHTRRTILKVGGTVAIAGLVSSGTTIAQTDLPLEIEQNAEDEYVVIRNIVDEEVDISNYQINFEAGEDSNEDQIRQLADEVVIPAGEEVRVATGALEVSGDNVVQLTEPYERPELNNEDPDVVALLDPDDNVIVRSDGSTGGDDDDDTDDSPTGTLTVTVEDGDGEPVDGIQVVGIGPDAEIYSGYTDENGQATFDLIDGDYTWHVTTDDTEYDDSSEEEITMDGNDESITLTVQADDDSDDNGDDDSGGSDDDSDDDDDGSDDSSGDDSDDSDDSDKSDDDCPKR